MKTFSCSKTPEPLELDTLIFGGIGQKSLLLFDPDNRVLGDEHVFAVASIEVALQHLYKLYENSIKNSNLHHLLKALWAPMISKAGVGTTHYRELILQKNKTSTI